MQKIPCLFQRDQSQGNYNTLVRDEVTPGCEWVTNGEGVATQKWDGACCLIRDGKLYKRYEVKKGKKAPEHFEPACEVDPNTGKQQGWVPVGPGPEDKWFREGYDTFVHAFDGIFQFHPPDGTYELCGPKVQSNRERCMHHQLFPHGKHLLHPPRTFDGFREWLKGRDIEGVVWWHPDGRMVKLRKADFGLPRVAGQRIS